MARAERLDRAFLTGDPGFMALEPAARSPGRASSTAAWPAGIWWALALHRMVPVLKPALMTEIGRYLPPRPEKTR